jgi:uncharacterized protein (TIGR02453 family)
MSFSGFPPELFKFLKELKKNNNRDWFAENKQRYEQAVVAPALNFIEAMQPGVTKISRFLEAVPKKQGGSLMRIYRDTRFSKNKLPYKTNVGIHFRHSLGCDVHAPGLYVHLEPEGCFLGAGTWMPPAEPLAMIRQAICDDPKRLRKIRTEKKFAGKFRFSGDPVKTVPRGYAKDHPAIDDLRCKSFAAIATMMEKDLASSGVIANILDVFAVSRPLMKFLCDALEQPF